MRTHTNTHPDFDFPIGHARPERRPRVVLCEDCPAGNRHPAMPHSRICLSCARSRERIAASLLGTLGAPFPV
jgi:hypothetical protein